MPIWGLALLQVPLWAGYLGVVVVGDGTKGDGSCRTWAPPPAGSMPRSDWCIGIVTQLLVLPVLYLPIFRLTGTDADDLSASGPRAGRQSRVGAQLAPVRPARGHRRPGGRGAVLPRSLPALLTKRGMPTVAAVLISTAVFAAIHFQVLQFAGLFVFGVVAGTLALRTGRLGGAIWAHIGFNMTTVVVLYLAS